MLHPIAGDAHELPSLVAGLSARRAPEDSGSQPSRAATPPYSRAHATRPVHATNFRLTSAKVPAGATTSKGGSDTLGSDVCAF